MTFKEIYQAFPSTIWSISVTHLKNCSNKLNDRIIKLKNGNQLKLAAKLQCRLSRLNTNIDRLKKSRICLRQRIEETMADKISRKLSDAVHKPSELSIKLKDATEPQLTHPSFIDFASKHYVVGQSSSTTLPPYTKD